MKIVRKKTNPQENIPVQEFQESDPDTSSEEVKIIPILVVELLTEVQPPTPAKNKMRIVRRKKIKLDPRNPSGGVRQENRISVQVATVTVVKLDPRNPSGGARQEENRIPVQVAVVKLDPRNPSGNVRTVVVVEPLLMPHQELPFNNDHFVEEEFLKLKEKFKIETVVELGTCVGGTSKWFGENFDNVNTIEINEYFQGFAKQRCSELKNISFFLGSTVDKLAEVLKKCGDNSILFVDSHWGDHFPLFNELDIIKESGLKPVIIIHDCKVPNEPSLGFDSYKGIDICFDSVKIYLDAIYGVDQYEHYYNSESTSTDVKRGFIYIHPKVTDSLEKVTDSLEKVDEVFNNDVGRWT